MIKISLCMIVRDEAEMLPGCLQSVKAVVDEIIVVDTGSLDNTIQLAREYGASIFEYAWNDDFSAARNLSLDKADGDWILVLDADERLTEQSASDLRSVVDNCKAEAIRVRVRDIVRDQDTADYLINTSTRLFRNRPQYRYERCVHEQIDAAILAAKLGPPPVIAELTIDHYGYLSEIVATKNKRSRNLRLTQNDVKVRGDGFSYYNLGVELIRHQRHGEALEALDQALQKLDKSLLVAAEASLRKALCLSETGRLSEALSVLNEALSLYPDFTDLVFHSGEVLCQMLEYRQAIVAFEKCRAMGDPSAGYYSVQGVGGYRSAYAIGLIHHALRNYPEALLWYRQSLRENLGYKPAIMRIAEVLKDTVSGEDMEKELAKYFDLSSNLAKKVYLEVLYTVGRHHTVFSLAKELLDSPNIMARAAMSALNTGQWKECIKWAGELVEKKYAVVDNLLLIIVSCWAMGELGAGQKAINQLARERVDMLRAICQQMQWYREGREDFSLSIDFMNRQQNVEFHEGVLRVLKLVVATRDRKLLSQVLPILSPLEGHGAWLQLGLCYYRYGQEDLAWAELFDCEQKGIFSAESLFVLGKIAAKNRHFQLAVDYLYRSLEMEPQLIEARQLLAHSCQDLGQMILIEGIERFPDAVSLVAELEGLKKERESCTQKGGGLGNSKH